jgi:hypothetical protein
MTTTRLTVGWGSGQRHRRFSSNRGLCLDGIEAALSHRLFQVDDDSLDAARRHPVPDVVDVRLVWLAKVSAEGKHLQALLHEALAHSLGVEAS